MENALKLFYAMGQFVDNSREYPNREWGYGRLCLKNTLDLLKK